MDQTTKNKIQTKCCVAGGGPAGMISAYLLARQGVDVVVLEKWPDFFRDFRGDTIHPSTMELLDELGLLEKFLSLPHQKTHKMAMILDGEETILADFGHLKVKAPYIAFMPQWDFLNFIAEEARALPNFHLMMETEVIDLIEKGNKVIGVKAKNSKEEIEIYSDLVIAADGRHSIVRKKSGLEKISTGVPIDVLWFPIPREKTDPAFSLGHIKAGQFMVMLERDSYWQCGYIIPKDGFEKIKTNSIEEFHNKLKNLVDFDESRFRFITEWNDLKLLSVTVDYLKKWYKPGLICIGDSAHAMSPIGGVGINLAIQDAVATARILGPGLKNGNLTTDSLKAIQKRRMFPARVVQRMQVFLQNRFILPNLKSEKNSNPSVFIRAIRQFPILRRIPAYFIGIGVRPEHFVK